MRDEKEERKKQACTCTCTCINCSVALPCLFGLVLVLSYISLHWVVNMFLLTSLL